MIRDPLALLHRRLQPFCCSGCFRLERCRVWLAPTGKRRLGMAHTLTKHWGSRRWTWQLEGKPPSIWARWRHRAVAPRVSPTLQMHYIPPWFSALAARLRRNEAETEQFLYERTRSPSTIGIAT